MPKGQRRRGPWLGQDARAAAARRGLVGNDIADPDRISSSGLFPALHVTLAPPPRLKGARRTAAFHRHLCSSWSQHHCGEGTMALPMDMDKALPAPTGPQMADPEDR